MLNSFLTAPPATGLRSDVFTAGMTFSVTKTIQVSALGRAYFSGNTGDHVIRLWISTNTSTPLVTATILAATASDAQGIKYVSISPITLTTGNTYAIAIDETNGDTWKDEWIPSLSADFNFPFTAYTESIGAYPSSNSGGGMYSSTALQFIDTFNIVNFNIGSGVSSVGANLNVGDGVTF